MKNRTRLIRFSFYLIFAVVCAQHTNAQLLKKLGKIAGQTAERDFERRAENETIVILFESGSATLRSQSMGIIRQIYQVLEQDATIELRIVGHTDADRDDSRNRELSKGRAEAVKSALTKVYGISPERLLAEGKVVAKPVGDNNTLDGKA